MSKTDWLKELQNLEMLKQFTQNNELLEHICSYINYIQDRIQSFEGDSNHGQIHPALQPVPIPVHRR